MGRQISSRFFPPICIASYLALSTVLTGGPQQPPKSVVPDVSTDHLKIWRSPAESTVTPGAQVSFGVEIEPRSRMHVYAPGAENYRVVSLNISLVPFIRRLPIQYPPSETYFFEPFKERVPVYQKPFKLMQEVVFENTPEAETAFRQNRKLTLKGTLDYQACDDNVCFLPVSVPLSWTVQLRRVDSAK